MILSRNFNTPGDGHKLRSQSDTVLNACVATPTKGNIYGRL